MDTIAHYFRAIHPAFLDKEWERGFEIYYKVNENESTKFLKFTDYNPSNHERILDLMKSEDCHDFFIHENDLIRYYREFVLARLRNTIEDRKPSQETIRMIYSVSRNILSEYFANIASTRILRVIEEPVSLLADQFEQGCFNFSDVFSILEKDSEIYTHASNIGLYCTYLGAKFKMGSETVKELALGGFLFDVGKKNIPSEIISKNDELSPDEFKMVRRHPAAGKKILNDMKCYSENIRKMAAEHHEHCDGSGYPLGLEGDQISLYARVGAILDVFNALTSKRNHRDAYTPIEALTAMKENMSGKFDQQLFIGFIKTLTSSS